MIRALDSRFVRRLFDNRHVARVLGGHWAQRVLDSRYRISTQINLAIGAAVALTVCASFVGWLSFNQVGDVQRRVNEGSIPEMKASFGVAQYSQVLVAAAPRLTAAATREEFEQLSLDIQEAHRAYEEQLALLEQRGAADEEFVTIRAHADTLISNIAALQDATSESFMLAEGSGALRDRLAVLRSRLDSILVPVIDDQTFYMTTGYRNLGEPPAFRSLHFSESELGYYRHLRDLQSDGNKAMEVLASAFTISEASLIEPLREQFEAAKGRTERSLSSLEGSPLQAEVSPIFDELFAQGIGESDGFDLLARRLTLGEVQQGLLESNNEIAVALVAQVNGLVSAASLNAQAAAEASSQAILTGRTLLVVLSGISIAGALIIAWLFVGRILVRRLVLLADRMKLMASGDLEAIVEIEGRDEVAEMGAALEVFRRHALEVQRLNLVEQLAEELRGKNDELESVLVDLRRAQDQIVMREKLAALGQLTAGVAHEIRNPLNFVNNFSEVSQELIAELEEVLEGAETSLNDEQSGQVSDIFGDLRDNLGRIRSHGERANRIVHDMLQMGRDSGQSQLSNINNLLDEHARLAYHSARATDADFQLDLKQELDPDLGELEVVPQEMGRVFLNMVSNACYATDEKRRALAGTGGGPYMPTLLLTTKRTEEHLEIGIRDNGIGMPPEVVEKMFIPFYTTKPTDKGTGLGLAMCSDIIREHGGTIDVESVPGEFTQMTVLLPLTRPAPGADHLEAAALRDELAAAEDDEERLC